MMGKIFSPTSIDSNQAPLECPAQWKARQLQVNWIHLSKTSKESMSGMSSSLRSFIVM